MGALIDRRALDTHTMSDKPLQEELFCMYFKQSEFYLDQLREAVDSGNVIVWQDTAHALKGSAQTLGLIEISQLTYRMEKSTPSQKELSHIESVLDKTHSAVREFLG